MSMHEDAIPDPQECANCGATQNLLKCSRCHTVWFCGVKCQKSYWPFHKTSCKRNEFADAIEESEPKFAKWMRNHGKLAVLKDDEVDRIERASTSVTGETRTDVMESMYGRLEPKPRQPSYTAEEKAAMRHQTELEAQQARQAAAALTGASYLAIELPQDLGMDCFKYKWRQNQSHVELFIPLPPGTTRRHLHVELTTTSISVFVHDQKILKGRLYHEIKAEESTWFIQDSMLEMNLLKRNRRGRYEQGTTNADTYWRSVIQQAPENERLALEHAPTSYYWSHCEDLPKSTTANRLRNRAVSDNTNAAMITAS